MACATGGWGETGSETGKCQSSEQTSKNAHSPSRPVHAVLARLFGELCLIGLTISEWQFV